MNRSVPNRLRLLTCLLLVGAGRLFPGDARGAGAAWAWREGEGLRYATLAPTGSGRAGFTVVPPARTGVFFTNHVSYEKAVIDNILLEGGGVAAGDYDGDGWTDLYFCQVGGTNALFRNLGDWRFQDVTAAAGVGCAGQTSRGAAFADLNGDGRLDLFVTALGGPNACLLNLGNGRFRDATQTTGLAATGLAATSLAVADVDGDGWLDLYVVNNTEYEGPGGQLRLTIRMVNGRPRISGRAARSHRIVDGLLLKLGAPDTLYRNVGEGRFAPVAWRDGTFRDPAGRPWRLPPRGLGLTAVFHDLNGDLAPDLYVCNDLQTPDRIWLNDGAGGFRPLPETALRTTCVNSMTVAVADIDRDGHDDLFVADMLSRQPELRLTQSRSLNPPSSHTGVKSDRHQANRNTLLLAREDGTYAGIANFAGVDASDWTWAAGFLDVDLDGFEDLLIANGHPYDLLDLDQIEREATRGRSMNMRARKDLRAFPPLLTPNYLFRNRGDRTFTEVGARWGFASTNISQALAFADLDNDGDLDVVVGCLDQPPLLCRNDTAAPRVAVRLRGRPPNTRGIGARVWLRGGAVPEQQQEMTAGGRYLSGDPPLLVFAAGTPTNRLSLEVRWRSGRRSLVRDVRPNRIYEIDEPTSNEAPTPARHEAAPAPRPLFADVSAMLGHRPVDPPFDDLDRQPLLHRLYSRRGPAVAWQDLDGDGREELIVGAGRGGRLAVFGADGKGGWRRRTTPGFDVPLPDDATGLAGWTPTPGRRALLVGLSSYETGPGQAPPVALFEPGAPPRAALAGGVEGLQPGPLAVADVDRDGDLDLFVGGQPTPGRYPEAAPSRLFRNEQGRLTPDAANNAALAGVGLVNGAVFSDVVGDDRPDLVLAGEWGPLRVFQNLAGRFEEVTDKVGLAALTGWWNGVATGDFDADGRLDLVAANWGWNSSWHRPSADRPVRFYYGDFDQNDTVEILETEYDPVSGRWLPRRNLGFLRRGWPLLGGAFTSYRQFAQAGLQAVLDAAASPPREVAATTFASMILLNRGDRFEARPLPAEAQFAPAFGVAVADLDGDGAEDIVLAQNCFSLRPEEPRLDAGRGLWLRGDGRGGFAAVSGSEAGIKVLGEQRGLALGDYDADGRVDLVVAQSGDETKLFHNLRARPGLRVRLRGAPGNPTAVGARLRLRFGDRAGPVREIQAGAGWWSQSAPVQVLATPSPASAIEVRWPDGRTTLTPLPANARAVVVRRDGTLSAD